MTSETPPEVELSAVRDGRLYPYCALGLGLLAATLLFGRPVLAAVAAPFLVALALGLRRTGPLRMRGAARLDADQVLEGDLVTCRVALDWDGPLDVQVLLRELTGVAAAEGQRLSWSLPGVAGPVEIPVRLRADHWGRHTIGEIWVRARTPYGLLVWEGKVATAPLLRVLPSSERLTRLLDPSESRAVAGVHRSTRIGDGSEFAELRPYVPGDRLRDLNWGATARHRRPYVNRHHPELSGEVVIVLDTYADDSTEALARAARAAWAIAAVHLQGNDRVGLIGLGGRWRQLHPAGGRRAKYELMETLLGIGADVADETSKGWLGLRLHVPESALVIVLSPLYQRHLIRRFQDWRAKGRAVAVAMVDTRDLLGPPASADEAAARRLWSLELDSRRRELTDVGIPVVPLAGDGPTGPAVAALRKARQAPMLRMGR